jgi:hypothetical protein
MQLRKLPFRISYANPQHTWWSMRREDATVFGSYSESRKTFCGTFRGLRKSFNLCDRDVTQEFDGEMNVVGPDPTSFYIDRLPQSGGMVGEFLLQIRWKVNSAENPPSLAHWYLI